MSLTRHARCNACGRVVEDHRTERGWIVLEGSKSFRLKVYHGTPPHRYKAVSKSRVDFCNVDCFNDWIEYYLPEPEEVGGDDDEDDGAV